MDSTLMHINDLSIPIPIPIHQRGLILMKHNYNFNIFPSSSSSKIVSFSLPIFLILFFTLHFLFSIKIVEEGIKKNWGRKIVKL